jgi:nucleoside-diphosphate-sugar epimerase
LVTGATGSVGSNICRLAAERGIPVRGLVRDLAAAHPLKRLGIELVQGDVRQPASLKAATSGVGTIIHAAAQIGGTWSAASAADFEAVNQQGTANILDAAGAASVARTVVLLSTVVMDRSCTVTEVSPLLPISPQNSPYTRSKLCAYYDGMARAARGMGVTFVLPGALYGPTPLVDRALVPTIFTGTLLAAARGELTEYLPTRMDFVLASEVAEISLAAAEKGRSGARYLAAGRPEDAVSLPEFCNRFLHLAGIAHRVCEVDISNPAALEEKFGTMVKYLRTTYPDPSHDASVTTAEPGVVPAPLDEGLALTVEWLRAEGRI